MAFKNVDKVNGRTIRKLFNKLKPDQVFNYISGVADADGDLTEVMEHSSLTAARTACGAAPADNPKTAPKSSYPQNQKGYDPHGGSKKKAA